jgi:hypothetical protein
VSPGSSRPCGDPSSQSVHWGFMDPREGVWKLLKQNKKPGGSEWGNLALYTFLRVLIAGSCVERSAGQPGANAGSRWEICHESHREERHEGQGG